MGAGVEVAAGVARAGVAGTEVAGAGVASAGRASAGADGVTPGAAGGWGPISGGDPGIAPAAGGDTGVAVTGRSAWWPIGSPHAGQKRSPLPWIAAHRGHAAMPASRSTVTGRRAPRAPSNARSSSSKRTSTASFAATSSSWRWPRRCISNTRPPRSRYASSLALRRKRTLLRIRPRSRKPGGRGSAGISTPAGTSTLAGVSVPAGTSTAEASTLAGTPPCAGGAGGSGARGFGSVAGWPAGLVV